MRSLWFALSDRAQVRAIKLVAGLVALGATGFGIWAAHHAWSDRDANRPFAGGITTTGTVVDWDVRGSRGGESYRPVIDFTDRQGKHHRFHGAWRSQRIEVGYGLAVSYVPADPSQARDLSVRPPPWQVGFALGTTVVIGIPAFSLWVIRRWRRPLPIVGDG